ncbi:MAG: NosD domain-containing protein [Candidatus Bathyarchaeia archaeon]|jgi:parallel beta-helix repeat protein
MKAKHSFHNRIKGWLPKEPLQTRRIGAASFRSHVTLIFAATLIVSSAAVSYIFYFSTPPIQTAPVVADYNPLTTEGLNLHDYIYIKPDGSLWPNASANVLKVDGLVYTFTQNISNSILIQRDGITLDGAGYFLVGPGNHGAIELNSVNSTVKNLKIVEFESGIQATGDYCTICDNYISANISLLLRANHLNVTGNYLVNCLNGKVDVVNPAIQRWHYSVYIEGFDAGCYNYFSNNQIVNFTGAIRMMSSVGNTITNNNLENNSIGIELKGGSSNVFYGNNISQCTEFAVSPYRSNNNIFYGNNFMDNVNQVVDACSYILVPKNISSNLWDNGEMGNFWSNYPIEKLQPRQTPSIIGNNPYQLYTNNTDHHPLLVPTFFQVSKTEGLGP